MNVGSYWLAAMLAGFAVSLFGWVALFLTRRPRRRVSPRSRPMTAIIVEVDAHTAAALVELQKVFGETANAGVIRKAVALANVVAKHAGSDNTVTLAPNTNGTLPLKISLAR
jgi:hypothetical protein